MPDLASLTVAEASHLLRTRALSPVELTRSCLERIEALNPRLNAFITVTGEQALTQAHEAEEEIGANRWRGPLHGIPVSLKDIIDLAGVRTTAASAQLLDNIATEDAEVVRRLRQAGAIFIGKTNLHEFAYGGSTVISYFGPTHNPWDLSRTTGGSSGGAAAAVAAGLCPVAIGTDTAGSIRLPAALCGVVGMRPTYGAVSTHGVHPLSRSYDTIGPITRTAADAALVLAAIIGYDRRDPASVSLPAESFPTTASYDLSRVRVGVARAGFFDDLDPEVSAAVERAIQTVAAFTAGIREDVTVPIDPDFTVHICEAYAYHSRWLQQWPERYQPETLRRLRNAESVKPSEYEEKLRQLQHYRGAAMELAFRNVDVILSPAAPAMAPEISELLGEPAELRRKETALLRNARAFSVLGVPAVSVPCGFSRAGLPIGLQIAARTGADALALAIAACFEQQAGFVRIANP